MFIIGLIVCSLGETKYLAADLNFNVGESIQLRRIPLCQMRLWCLLSPEKFAQVISLVKDFRDSSGKLKKKKKLECAAVLV